MRAPEVYLGQPCTTPCQIWACAALLLCWLQPDVLGASGNTGGELLRNAWCISKLKRLFPAWNDLPTVDDPVTKADFQVTDMFLAELEQDKAHPILQDVLPLDRQMEKMGLLPELRDLLRSMFVLDPDARPSASQVLASRELWALKEAVTGME
jgi:serine/threonine protein kinase